MTDVTYLQYMQHRVAPVNLFAYKQAEKYRRNVNPMTRKNILSFMMSVCYNATITGQNDLEMVDAGSTAQENLASNITRIRQISRTPVPLKR